MFGLLLVNSATVALSVQVLKDDLALLLVAMILAVAWVGLRDASMPAWLLMPFLAFYVELPFRRIEVAGAEYNFSYILFLVLLVILTKRGWQMLRASEHALQP
jgi:hypothetical protein